MPLRFHLLAQDTLMSDNTLWSRNYRVCSGSYSSTEVGYDGTASSCRIRRMATRDCCGSDTTFSMYYYISTQGLTNHAGVFTSYHLYTSSIHNLLLEVNR